MHAIVLSDIGKIEYTTASDPVIREGYCIVKPKAFGICGSDIPRAYTTGAHVHPLVLGHEFSGVVNEVNPGSEFKPGDRVGVFPLIPCNKCKMCMGKKYEMCENYSYLGSRCDGGFADLVAVPEWNLIRLDDGISFEAAAMLEPLAVAAHAVRRAVIGRTQDSKVLVIGLGTIGLFTVMILKSMGFDTLYTAGNKEFQRNSVAKLGVPGDRYIDSGKTPEKLDGISADIVFECVGKELTYAQAIDAAAPSGTVMLVGNPASDMGLSRAVYWKILRNQLTVLGTWNSSYTKEPDDDWQFVINLLNNGIIKPEQFITHKFELKDLITGFEIMRDKKEDYIKIMGINP